MTPWGSLFEGKSSSSPHHSRQGEVDKDVVTSDSFVENRSVSQEAFLRSETVRPGDMNSRQKNTNEPRVC